MAERAHSWIERWLERLAIYLPIYLFAEPCVLCAFWLGNVLRATTARTVSTSQRPKAVRTRQFSTLYTWKCASRHNGCKFSSLLWPAASAPSALASLLFDPPETRTIGKHCVSRLSFLFAHLDLPSSDFLPLWSSLFWLSLPLSFFLAVLFHLSILSEVWLVNFLRSQCENVKKMAAATATSCPVDTVQFSIHTLFAAVLLLKVLHPTSVTPHIGDTPEHNLQEQMMHGQARDQHETVEKVKESKDASLFQVRSQLWLLFTEPGLAAVAPIAAAVSMIFGLLLPGMRRPSAFAMVSQQISPQVLDRAAHHCPRPHPLGGFLRWREPIKVNLARRWYTPFYQLGVQLLEARAVVVPILWATLQHQRPECANVLALRHPQYHGT